MKHIVKKLALGVSAIIIIFLAGPRVEIKTEVSPVDLPPDLDQYLVDTESPFDDIVPETEKTIIWAGEVGTRTPFSIVYFHGFSATRQELSPLSETVAKQLGANLFYTRFTGHGRSEEAMADGSVKAWINDAHEALSIGHRLGEQVVVIGTSTGGTIATWMAAQPTTKPVEAWILISPNFGPTDRKAMMLLWPWGRYIAEFLIGPERSRKPHNAQHGQYWTNRYPTRALLPLMGIVNLIDSSTLGSIDSPVLMVYSPGDKVVSSAAIQDAFSAIGSPKKRLIPYLNSADPDQHILAGDIFSPNSTKEIATMIIEFITEFEKN